MKIEREENALFNRIVVQPWDSPLTATVTVLQWKFQKDMFTPANNVSINMGTWQTDIENARVWANAILRACEIADEMKG